MFNDGGVFLESWGAPGAPPEPPVPTREWQVDRPGLPESSEERNLGTATTHRPRWLTGSLEDRNAAQGGSRGSCPTGEAGLVSTGHQRSHSLVGEVEFVGKIFCII